MQVGPHRPSLAPPSYVHATRILAEIREMEDAVSSSRSTTKAQLHRGKFFYTVLKLPRYC
ncbi:hypothetical protein DBB29_14050 [Pandoraea cepalis]|uniref:Uncharacterized protein n=1 Tax=Pandoraea cepalis TaxID=2508294 RepID=A0AAW7MRH6_9BURK|nr:hypothetical protein [Pandoraea cepalis]MDN4579238.1 hypothetical protein [Pandoraea cepalis]